MTGAGDAALVRLAGVGRTYATGTVALDGLDLDLDRHELLSLLGPSGCGKTTVLRLVAGLDAPTRGTVTWADGAVPAGAIGYVLQEPTLMPWATVFDNVRLPLRLSGADSRETRERVAAMIERVGLGRFAGAYPRELSGGMRMRVSIARALVTEPRLLLLDEPFAALDEITRFRLDDMLLELWSRSDWTILFVTHSVFESVYLSTRVAVMAARPGRIVATRTVDAPYPRGDAFRASHGFTDRCAEISGLLRAAIAAGEAA